MNKLSSSWGRMLLACVAVLAVAGSGVVFAAGPGPSYVRPKLALIEGPGSVQPNSATPYTLLVTFTDNTQSTFIAPLVTWGASAGSWTGSDYMAPGAPTTAKLTAQYTSAGATVNATRAILVQN